ncbi:TssN family type VI secretion system protein [Aquimarina sp. MMG016]|uniref:TssN family type VI secretion system protein n=1 Tax=Aquimarina sp. MMG016 TaxID=2822690 RepID=UPI001B3A4691|nr:TssN family type VI secretion system protein [Aquimarina sp. MMG016]MBQ4821281.1 hypothetical protein [Aquimarina sp. MMG016]
MNLILLSAVSMDSLKLGIVMIAISALLMGFVAGLKKLFTKNKKKFFLYILVTLLLFAATALLSNEKVLNDIPLNSFIGFQVIFLLLGCLHVFALRKFFPDLSESITDFWSEFLYTIVTTLLGLFAFIMVVELYKPEYKYIFLASAIFFITPFMVVKLYEYAISVPMPIYKKWFYPIDKKMKDPKAEELTNPLVISFEFNKGENHEELSNFRLKAPEKMEFGKLFYFFINDYNDRHPEGEIKFLDDKNNPYGWVFYTKPKWFKAQNHIDFTRTVEGNNIKEDDVIICKRA